MKRIYSQPIVEVTLLEPSAVVLAASPNQGININPDPGTGVDGD